MHANYSQNSHIIKQQLVEDEIITNRHPVSSKLFFSRAAKQSILLPMETLKRFVEVKSNVFANKPGFPKLETF